MFIYAFLTQETEIDNIHQLVVGTTENVKEGNEDIREVNNPIVQSSSIICISREILCCNKQSSPSPHFYVIINRNVQKDRYRFSCWNTSLSLSLSLCLSVSRPLKTTQASVCGSSSSWSCAPSPCSSWTGTTANASLPRPHNRGHPDLLALSVLFN